MKTNFNSFIKIAAVTIALGLTGIVTPALAVRQTGGEYNTLYAGLGAKGYDVVAYFAAGKAVPGSDRYVTEYGGVKWQFSSADNAATFKSDPAKYAPQYGGFCAWGASVGKLFDVDPVTGWQIVDGKLYLNFNADINATFSKDPQGFIAKANRNWATLNK
ncbi:MAG: YHS domain-containing (seleno)protein [Betaproteobacteria bacterium]